MIELMDTLEEHHDYGILYCHKSGSREARDSRVAESVELANVLDRPDLAAELRSVMTQAYEAQRPSVLATDHKSSFTIGPQSQPRPRSIRALSHPRAALRAAGRVVASRRA